MINVIVLRNYLANCTENVYMKVCTHIVQSLQKMYNVGYKCNQIFLLSEMAMEFSFLIW